MTADFWGLPTAGGTATAYGLLAGALEDDPNLEVRINTLVPCNLIITCSPLQHSEAIACPEGIACTNSLAFIRILLPVTCALVCYLFPAQPDGAHSCSS